MEGLGVGVPEALLQHHPGEAAAGLDTQGSAKKRKRTAGGLDEPPSGRGTGQGRCRLDAGTLTHGRASFRLTRPTHGPPVW